MIFRIFAGLLGFVSLSLVAWMNGSHASEPFLTMQSRVRSLFPAGNYSLKSVSKKTPESSAFCTPGELQFEKMEDEWNLTLGSRILFSRIGATAVREETSEPGCNHVVHADVKEIAIEQKTTSQGCSQGNGVLIEKLEKIDDLTLAYSQNWSPKNSKEKSVTFTCTFRRVPTKKAVK